MANFTSSYLGILRKRGMIDSITDENGIEISTIKISEPEDFEYRKPRIVIDRFEEKRDMVEPDILYIRRESFILGELGFVITSERAKKRWFKHQQKIYRLCYKNEAPSTATILVNDRLPPNHYIEYDRANKIVRIVGKNTGINGVGEWLRVY